MRFFSFSVNPGAGMGPSPAPKPTDRFGSVLSNTSTVIKSLLLTLVAIIMSLSFVSRQPALLEANLPIESDLAALVGSEYLHADAVKDGFDPLEDEANSDEVLPYEAYIDIFVRNADPDQELLQSMDNAMPADEFESLQNCLRDHPMRHWNVNDDTTFQGTKGFLLSFSEEGIKKFEKDDQFNCLEPYFRRHRLPNTNAWVLNMVWAEIPDFTRELAIRRHTDDAIMLDYEGSKKVMPFQTNVLYVFVPEDMIGGQLEAWDYNITPEDVANGPKARVVPVENRMAYFRGDAQHQVRSYNTSSTKVLRGSLVLEQYAIPEDYQHLLVDWHWRDRHDSEMM